MAELTYDSSAVAVAQKDSSYEGAVMFHGWLGPVDAEAAEAVAEGLEVKADTKKVRLYVDPQFLDWLLLETDDIISKSEGGLDGGSYVLVRREARIRRCQDGRAFWFKRVLDETEDDPTARHPRPPL